MPASARLDLRIDPDNKALIERAAALSRVSMTTFVTNVLVARAREIVEGPSQGARPSPRKVGGWSFPLPEGWDAPLDDLAEYR